MRAYFDWHTYAHFFSMIFISFQNFSGSYNVFIEKVRILGSTIGKHRVRMHAYFDWHTYAHFFSIIFISFQNFSGSYNKIIIIRL